MDVRVDDGRQFALLAARFKRAGRNGAIIRKMTTRSIQATLRPLVRDIQSAVEHLQVKTGRSTGRGSLSRERFDEALRARKAEVARRRGHHTNAALLSRRSALADHRLRYTISRGVKSRVQYSGFRLGARVFVDSSVLPQSQRSLPRHLNSRRGWRHPVWGNREVWVQQIGGPYFDEPIRRHRARIVPAVRRDIDHALRQIMEVTRR